MRFEKVACDRCGSEIDMTIPHKRDIWLSGKGREGGLDLCDDCYKELVRFITNYCPTYIVDGVIKKGEHEDE